MKIIDIEKLVHTYSHLSKGVVDFKKYTYYALTHHSTSIEGSTLTESQVINLLEYGKTATNKPYEHHQMVSDHYLALQYVVAEAQKKSLLNVIFIKEIGAQVMKNTGGFVNTVIGVYDISKGDFRLGSVRAGTRTFPDYAKVPMLIANLCKQVNDFLQSKNEITFAQKCELAFQVHFDFVSIHPFGDGNGRTARLLMNYIQAFFGLPLSIVYKQDRIKYINALEQSRNHEEMSYFYNFMYLQYAKFLKENIKEM
ncbi:MAG: Fic family protein [Cytophagales bacterium]|nr:MAG: Fic family protein [Cytophagales bacterium]